MFKVCTARGAWLPVLSPGLSLDPNKMSFWKKAKGYWIMSLIEVHALLFCLTHHHVGLAKHRKFPLSPI